MVDRDETFPLDFTIELSDPAVRRAAELSFNAEGAVLLAPSFEIDVSLDDEVWRGSFFGGRDGACSIINGPRSDVLIAVAKGIGYSVPLANPRAYSVVPLRPLRGWFCSRDGGVVVLVGYTSLVAIDLEGGVRWQTARLVSDGFTEVRPTSDSVVVRGFHPSSNREVELTLGLSTGEVLDSR